MTFHPVNFLGKPLGNLAAELAQIDPKELDREIAEKVELYTSMSFESAILCRPTTLLLTTLPEANLPNNHPDVDLPGVVLETYLGGGGQGWVYVGRVKATNNVVAVKVLRGDADTSQNAASREARLCARLHHRNILRVFRTEEVGSFWVVIMELVQGDELHRNLLSQDQWKQCFGQLADALHQMREEAIVHCDIKPANILLRQHDHSPVLVDFGVAVDLADPTPPRGISGTPYYMAPEVFLDNHPHPAWDAYSLGVTATVLLSGKQNGFHTFREIHDAKVSGKFDAVLRENALKIEDDELRQWTLELTGPEKEQRLNAVDTARHWSQTQTPSVN